MTFVLNILHNDYSLLAADKLGNTDGPTTLTVGGMTIRTNKGVTINGIRKMKVSKCGAVAIGIAGNTGDHPYLSEIETAERIDPALSLIFGSVQKYFLSPDRATNLSQSKVMSDEGIATFFDDAASRYFSLLYLYTHYNFSSQWMQADSGARLVHVGTGSNAFEKAVTLDAINAFIASLKTNPDPRATLEWIKDAFGKVSQVAAGVGDAPEFLLSTRSDPAFREFQ